jgi:hypothetical protein
VSFICFDLGVMNVIGGAGAALFYSIPLQAMGFASSSLLLGMFFIVIGLTSYKVPRLPTMVPIVIIVADVCNTIWFLPKYELAAGVVLVKISFLVPLLLTGISLVRVRLKLRSAKPDHYTPQIGSGKQAFALLSSMFVSVGAGIAALLLFARYAMPPLTESTNPLINIFHDLLLVPALLLLFPLGAALGELMWMQASRFYLSGYELALFIRYFKLVPFISRISDKLVLEPPPDRSAVTHDPALVRPRSFRKLVLVASLAAVPIFACALLIIVFSIPNILERPAYAGTAVAAPGTLVVSQGKDGQYRTINAAIAAAPVGATILVRPGVYRERVIVYKDITLIGDQKNPGDVTVKCYEDGCLAIGANAHVRNLTVTAKVGFLSLLFDKEHPAAVVVLKGRPTIEACDVYSNNGAGIVVTGDDAEPEIRNVKVHDCRLNGILFTEGSKGVVDNSEIYKNRWAGVRSDYGSNVTVRHSRIHSGKMDGVLADLQGAATVEDCDVFQNGMSGIHARVGSSVSFNRSRSFKNAGRGLMIHDRSSVKTDWSDVYENTNGGIDVTDESDAQITNTKVHHEKYAAITIREKSTAVVEGATIYENETGLSVRDGGKPVVRKSVFRTHVYSAIDVEDNGQLSIEQSQIYSAQGAGIYFHTGGKGRVQECAIFASYYSNIIIASRSSSQIVKTRLSEGNYAGILVHEGGQGSITDSQIFNNRLGVEIATNGNLSIQDCTIKDNRHEGVLADETSTGTITDSKLIGNADGAWKIAAGARLVRERNTE